jgi:hypothetical protein
MRASDDPMIVNSTPKLGAGLRRLPCALLLAACGSSSSAAREPTEVELATPIASGEAQARPLLVAASPDEPNQARQARGRAVTEEPCDSAGTLRSIHSDTPMHIDFVNRTSGWIDTYWISFDGRFIHYAELRPGDRYRQQTYVTHPWIALDRHERCFGVFVPHEAGVHVVEIGPD